MFRRQVRLRREYLYRKSIDQELKTIKEKKEKVRKALDENTKLTSDVKRDALQLQKSLAWDVPGLNDDMDDEYRWAGASDPKIMLTTSRDPSSKLKEFVKEMKLIFPNAQRMNRGRCEISVLMDACKQNDVTDLIIIHEHRGVPNCIQVCHLPYGPTAYFTLVNVVSRHEIPDSIPIPQSYPHLIFHNFKSKLGLRVTNILKYLFPVAKEEAKRVITFANFNDFISFRHHTYKKAPQSKDEILLTEIGPRFEMRLYEIKLGTLENEAISKSEWVLKPYMNTAYKRQFLSFAESDNDEAA